MFVPLQLADDLNAMLHSPYGSPSSFLQDVVPKYLENGYEVLIKGHPAATAERPGRVALEQERALSLGQDFGSHVSIVPADISWKDHVALLGNVDSVCTINSSVGFEATLLGRRLQLHGAAAYDSVGIQKASDVPTPRALELQNKNATFMAHHYLHPMKREVAAAVMRNAVRLALEHADNPTGADFWRKWVSEIKHREREDERRAQVRKPLKNRSARLRKALRLKPPAAGCVDRVECSRNAAGSYDISVEGWFIDRKTKQPPKVVALQKDGRILSSETVFFPRYDVVNVVLGYLRCLLSATLDDARWTGSSRRWDMCLGG